MRTKRKLCWVGSQVLTGVLATFLCVAPASAKDDFSFSIDEYLSQSLESINTVYPVVRCAGLYYSIHEYFGSENLGPGAEKRIRDIVNSFTKLASVMSVQKGISYDAVMQDISDIIDLYIRRMRANYVRSGQAFGGDPLIKDDLKYCETLVEHTGF